MAEKKEKKATKKKKAVKPDFYIQYGDKEIAAKAITERIKEIWTKEMENDLGDLKELQIYIKPEEDAAYFVINAEIKGSFGL